MKLGIISDTHSRETWFIRALDTLRDHNISVLAHCGDLTDFSMCRHMRGFQVFYAFGNGDFATDAIRLSLQQLNPASEADYSLEFELEGKSFFICHGNNTALLRTALASGSYDDVLRGHTHDFEDSRVGRSRLINPGALGDRMRPHRFAVLDLADDSLSTFELKE